MEWRDEGLIIGLRKHGETSVIVELMTCAHGRHLGIVKGGRARRLQPVLQQGNGLNVVWRARLEEHLGLYQIEEARQRAARLMASGAALAGIGLIGDLLRLLPERDPHASLYAMADLIAENLDRDDLARQLMVRFEMEILRELGFGLDISQCAASGARDDLIYVSPKSGRAVSRTAGAPWKDRLLPLPAFLLRDFTALEEIETGQLRDAFRLTGYFLERNVFGPRQVSAPASRARYLAHFLAQDQGKSAGADQAPPTARDHSQILSVAMPETP